MNIAFFFRTKHCRCIVNHLSVFPVHEPPYLISVLPKSIEIRTIDPHVLVQSINLQNVKCICEAGDHLYVASNNHVWRLSTVPIPAQIRQLLENREFELALQLAVSCLTYRAYSVL